MIKQILILFALVFAVTFMGAVAFAQTATMTPSPSPTTATMPNAAPNTGFGPLR